MCHITYSLNDNNHIVAKRIYHPLTYKCGKKLISKDDYRVAALPNKDKQQQTLKPRQNNLYCHKFGYLPSNYIQDCLLKGLNIESVILQTML